MVCSDGHAYVVKFKNNPQHLRVLANEYLATCLANAVGLSVPEVAVVDVSQSLVSMTSELVIEHHQATEPCAAGFQFGSRFVGGLLPGQLWDYLPEQDLKEVLNVGEFAGMLVLDKWTLNADGRQAVFHKRSREKRYMATFIDQGHCFNAGAWSPNDAPLRGVYARNCVYAGVTGWDSFEPWLSRVEAMDAQTAWYIASKVPEEWYGGPAVEFQMLIDLLFSRRNRIRDLIGQFRDSSREPFPRWTPTSYPAVSPKHRQVLSWKPC